MTSKKPSSKRPIKSRKPKADPSAQPERSRFQSFRVEQMPRSAIRTAPYNPRSIDQDARKKLQANLKAVGLLEPLIFNRTTGVLLGGHQRLACLDALEGHGNYLLDVSVVELTEKQEREQNVALNNAALQGSWDMDLLAALLKTPDLDLSATGFEPADIQLNFDDPELSSLFTPNEATAALVDALAGIKADASEQKRASRAPKGGGSSDGDPDPDDDAEGPPEPSTADQAKAFRKKGKDLFNSKDDTEVMACVIFKDRAERERFVERLGYDRDERYVDGGRVWARIAEAAEAPAPKAKSAGSRSKPST